MLLMRFNKYKMAYEKENLEHFLLHLCILIRLYNYYNFTVIVQLYCNGG